MYRENLTYSRRFFARTRRITFATFASKNPTRNMDLYRRFLLAAQKEIIF